MNEDFVESINFLARKVAQVGIAITPDVAIGGLDAQGCHVHSLTEAIMGVTSALTEITRVADAMEEIGSAMHRIADAIENKGQ